MRETSDRDVLRSAGSAGSWGLTLTSAAALLTADYLTKAWAESRLATGPCSDETCISIFGTSARLRLIYNTGAAFSTGEGLGWLLTPLAIVMAGYLFFLSTRTIDRWSLIALGSIAGGALGNVADRLVRAEDGFASGGVVDFIDFRFWPVFNVADIGVVCGVGLLIFRQIKAPDASLGRDDVEHASASENSAGSGASGPLDQ